MSAFMAGTKRGCTWFETDVDILGDGTPIIIHDTTLDRTTSATGQYYDLTVADLSNIDAGSWFGPEFTGERIPTLDQVVNFMNEHKVNFNIEIKSNEAGKDMTLRLIDAVIEQLERLDPGREVIVSSFNHVLLAKFKEKAPKLPVGVLYETCALYDDWFSMLQLVGADYIHPEDSGLTREKVNKFRKAGFGVNVWTVNSVARANELFSWGATGVFTDVADTMLHLQK